MTDPRKKKIHKDADDDSRDSRGFDALAELTSSEVVQQVKMGMSRIAPLDGEDSDEPAPY